MSRNTKALNAQRIHELNRILGENSGVACSRSTRRQEARTCEASVHRRDCPEARLVEPRRNCIPGARIVWPSV